MEICGDERIRKSQKKLSGGCTIFNAFHFSQIFLRRGTCSFSYQPLDIPQKQWYNVVQYITRASQVHLLQKSLATALVASRNKMRVTRALGRVAMVSASWLPFDELKPVLKCCCWVLYKLIIFGSEFQTWCAIFGQNSTLWVNQQISSDLMAANATFRIYTHPNRAHQARKSPVYNLMIQKNGLKLR